MSSTSGRPTSSVPLATARALRRRLTPQEARLWNLLRERFRARGHHFRRQVPIDRFVVDFACLKSRLVIEVDGGGHTRIDRAEADRLRDARLSDLGFVVLRVWNAEIDLGAEAVLDRIAEVLERTDPPTALSGV